MDNTRKFHSLKPNEVQLFGNWFDEGGYMITITLGKDTCSLYEIPQYGGEPQYYCDIANIQEAIKIGESWL